MTSRAIAIKIVGLASIVILQLMPAFSYPEYCPQAVAYRDGELFKTYEREIEKYQSLKSSLNLYQELRDTSFSDTELQKLQTTANFDTLFLLPAQTMSDLLKSVVPPAWVAGRIAEDTTGLSVKLVDALRAEKEFSKIKRIIEDDVTLTVAKIAFVQETGYVGSILTGFSELVDNLIENSSRVGEWKPILENMRNGIAAIDVTVDMLQQDLIKAEASISDVQYIKDAIDQVCGGYASSTEKRVLSLDQISNAIFQKEGSDHVSGQSFKFADGYGDYCIWNNAQQDLRGTGIDVGLGLNPRVAKIDKASSMLVFRSGQFVFSGLKLNITPEADGFSVEWAGSEVRFRLAQSWASATFGRPECR